MKDHDHRDDPPTEMIMVNNVAEPVFESDNEPIYYSDTKGHSKLAGQRRHDNGGFILTRTPRTPVDEDFVLSRHRGRKILSAEPMIFTNPQEEQHHMMMMLHNAIAMTKLEEEVLRKLEPIQVNPDSGFRGVSRGRSRLRQQQKRPRQEQKQQQRLEDQQGRQEQRRLRERERFNRLRDQNKQVRGREQQQQQKQQQQRQQQQQQQQQQRRLEQQRRREQRRQERLRKQEQQQRLLEKERLERQKLQKEEEQQRRRLQEEQQQRRREEKQLKDVNVQSNNAISQQFSNDLAGVVEEEELAEEEALPEGDHDQAAAPDHGLLRVTPRLPLQDDAYQTNFKKSPQVI